MIFVMKHMELKHTASNKGFTLVELLVTGSIIGVLASLLAVSVANGKNKAKDRECFNNQRNLKMGMENAYTDAITDYNFREHRGDEAEFIRIFVKENLRPLIPDNSIKGLGLYISKPLTCPYAANPGKVRAPFKIVPVKYWERETGISVEPLKGINYFSHTYSISQYFMKNDGENDGNNDLAVVCMKDGTREKRTLRDYLPWLEDQLEKKKDIDLYQTFTIDSSIMHPGKSRFGAGVTFGDGEQRWSSLGEKN